MQLILKSERWNREFPLLLAVFMSMPAVIISCTVVGESYPDRGECINEYTRFYTFCKSSCSCSFEESTCDWVSNNYFSRQSTIGDSYMLYQGDYIWNTARLESPLLCPTGNRLYSLSFQYSITSMSYNTTVAMSVYLRVNFKNISLWDSSNKPPGSISKDSENIFINCSECSATPFQIFFEGKMLDSSGGDVKIYTISIHYNGSLQTQPACPTHSETLSTASATRLPTAASNATEMGLSGCGPAHFNNDNRLPPGAEAGIVIAVILLVTIIISVFVIFYRKGNSCQYGLSCILKNPPNANHTASTDNQQRLGIDNSRFARHEERHEDRHEDRHEERHEDRHEDRHEERHETVTTKPDQGYEKKDFCTKRSVDYALANSSTSFEYSNVLHDKRVKDDVAKISQSALPLTDRTIPKDSATYNNYCNTFHNNQEVISASSSTYSNLQSDFPRRTVNHEQDTIETSLNYAEEYNNLQRNHVEDGHLASRKAEDTYNHLTNGSDEQQTAI